MRSGIYNPRPRTGYTQVTWVMVTSARSSFRSTSDGGFVLAPDELRAVLEHERALSDRSGEPFALLTFELGESSVLVLAERALAAITKRVRATDVLGWLSRNQLAVLLRYASVEDALRVGHEIRAQAAAASGELLCTVHGHPPFRRGEARSSEARPPEDSRVAH